MLAPDDEKRPPLKYVEIAKLLRKSGRRMTVAQLVEITGYTSGSIHSALSVLLARGMVAKGEHNKPGQTYWWNPEYVEKPPPEKKPGAQGKTAQLIGESGVQYAIRVSRTNAVCRWIGL